MTFKPLWRMTDLERAGIVATRANLVFEVMWSSMWPMGHCAVASLCLAPLLRSSLDVEWLVAVGRAHDCRPHAWVESPGGDVVDPTYGQFDGGPALRVVDARHVDELGHCPDLVLNLDQEEELRRTISPRRNRWPDSYAGWSARSAVRDIFDTNYPRYPRARRCT